jgi:hypothetical protein
MCIIIDANCAGDLIAQPISEMAGHLLKHLLSKGQLAHGGKLTEELSKTGFLRILTELARSGRARRYETAAIRAEEEKLVGKKSCSSNDSHVVALAIVSGARVVVTRDQGLANDITNPRLLRPKGKIYKSAEHKHLFGKCGACRAS